MDDKDKDPRDEEIAWLKAALDKEQRDRHIGVSGLYGELVRLTRLSDSLIEAIETNEACLVKRGDEIKRLTEGIAQLNEVINKHEDTLDGNDEEISRLKAGWSRLKSCIRETAGALPGESGADHIKAELLTIEEEWRKGKK